MISATMTTKGQITVPKSIRDQLRLSAGDKLEFILTNDKQVLMRPISKKVDDVFGMLHQPGKKAVSVDEMNTAIAQRVRDQFK